MEDAPIADGQPGLNSGRTNAHGIGMRCCYSASKKENSRHSQYRLHVRQVQAPDRRECRRDVVARHRVVRHMQFVLAFCVARHGGAISVCVGGPVVWASLLLVRGAFMGWGARMARGRGDTTSSAS